MRRVIQFLFPATLADIEDTAEDDDENSELVFVTHREEALKLAMSLMHAVMMSTGKGAIEVSLRGVSSVEDVKKQKPMKEAVLVMTPEIDAAEEPWWAEEGDEDEEEDEETD